MALLKRVSISGFKSIERTEVKLGRINVLIGANGAGKSNLLSFFEFVHDFFRESGGLQRFVQREGGANTLLFYGAKTTRCIEADICFEVDQKDITYRFRLTPTATDSLISDSQSLQFEGETVRFPIDDTYPRGGGEYGDFLGHPESQLAANIPFWNEDEHSPLMAKASKIVVQAIRRWRKYDFCDPSVMWPQHYMHDNETLFPNGKNLVAVLYKLQKTQAAVYRQIVDTIRQIVPWFDDFVLEPLKLKDTDVLLNWRDRYAKYPDQMFSPHLLPGGGLRAIALITLLLQPKEDLPPLIVIDEPELGLHPAAITVIASLLKAASRHAQIIIATQSITLLDEFDAADVIVVDREEGRSTFTRLDPERLKDWLEEYTLGELWQKNSIGGGPF